MTVISALDIIYAPTVERVTDLPIWTLAVSITATGHFADSLNTRGERRTVTVHATLSSEDAEPFNTLLTHRTGETCAALDARYTEEVDTAFIRVTVAINLTFTGEDARS